jgi:glycosyltransferase involved in cell wall biosynthesis
MYRIAVVTRYFPSSGEPRAGRSLYEILRVVARSTEVRVFYPNADYPAFLKPRSRTYDKLDPSFSPPDVSTRYLDYPALPLFSRPLNGWMIARTLLPHVNEYAPDLVLGVFLYPESFAALKIASALGVPVAAMSIGSDINRIGDPVSAWQTRLVLREADAVLTVSDDLRKKAVAMGAPSARTHAIHNGCDLSVFYVTDRRQAKERLNIDAGVRTIVYVGRLDLKKGLRELIQAAALLHPHRPALHTYVVGDGVDRTLIENSIRTCGANGYIHLVPGCSFDEVAVWMAAADLVTLPSYMEGCPNVILEALACGRPVVATRVGGIPEIMSDACGRLVPPRDPARLAEALSAVLDTSWDSSTIAAHGSRSWIAAAAELREIFDALVSRQRGTIRV